ncbi:proline-rich protein 2-like [Mustela lutreola]|uniref:proline-rich protein 2-like n=1 Tax=Mustela lutreola TaxID=9666 RepID=UPI002797443B|nr:proline-rich protein 2-like [Mustela lutreola]
MTPPSRSIKENPGMLTAVRACGVRAGAAAGRRPALRASRGGPGPPDRSHGRCPVPPWATSSRPPCGPESWGGTARRGSTARRGRAGVGGWGRAREPPLLPGRPRGAERPPAGRGVHRSPAASPPGTDRVCAEPTPRGRAWLPSGSRPQRPPRGLPLGTSPGPHLGDRVSAGPASRRTGLREDTCPPRTLGRRGRAAAVRAGGPCGARPRRGAAGRTRRAGGAKLPRGGAQQPKPRPPAAPDPRSRSHRKHSATAPRATMHFRPEEAAVLATPSRGRWGPGNAALAVSPRAFWESPRCLFLPPLFSTEFRLLAGRKPSFPGRKGSEEKRGRMRRGHATRRALGVAPQCLVGDVVLRVRTPPGWAGGGLGFPEGGAQLKMEPAWPRRSARYS